MKTSILTIILIIVTLFIVINTQDKDEFSLLYDENVSNIKALYNDAIGEKYNLKKELYDEYQNILKEWDNLTLNTTEYEIKNTLKNKNINDLNYKPSIAPISGKITITSPFGYRTHPIFKRKIFHSGVDIRCKTGTNILSTADGIVIKTGYNRGGYGYYIIIQNGEKYKTVYGHLSKILISKGENIKKGDIIGLSGNTGLSTAPHLHYEVIENNKKINPKLFLK